MSNHGSWGAALVFTVLAFGSDAPGATSPLAAPSRSVNSTPNAPASTPPQVAPRDLSELLHPILQKHNVPGMVAAIVEDDHVVAFAADGMRERGQPDRVTI